MKNLKFISAFCLFLILLSGLACKSKSKKPQSGDKINTVTLVEAVVEEIPDTLELKGTFIPSDKLDVKSELEAKVIAAPAQEGQNITFGDPLATLDAEKTKLLLEKTRADLKETELRIEAGMNLLNSNPEPSSVESSPQENTPEKEEGDEEVRNNDEVADEIPKAPENPNPHPSVNGSASINGGAKGDQILRAEEATLDRIKAEIALNEKRLEGANITAAISGFISRKNVTEGSVVNLGEILYQIVKLDPIYLSVYVNKDTVTQFKKGDRIEVFSEELPGQSLSGEVLLVGAEPDPQNKNYEVKISVSNTQQKLRGGLNGKIFAPLPEMKKSVQIPLAALLEKNGKAYVYLADGELASRKEVTLGRKTSDKVEIKKGVKEGEKVVLKGLANLSEDQEYIKLEN